MVGISGAGNRQDYLGTISTPANASRLGEVPNRPAISKSADPGWPQPAGQRRSEDETDSLRLAMLENRIALAVDQVVLILHSRDDEVAARRKKFPLRSLR